MLSGTPEALIKISDASPIVLATKLLPWRKWLHLMADGCPWLEPKPMLTELASRRYTVGSAASIANATTGQVVPNLKITTAASLQMTYESAYTK